MTPTIIETPPLTSRWPGLLGGPASRHLLRWEQEWADRLLADVFGYHALQVGQVAHDWLQANRMPHRWRARVECDIAAPSDGVYGLHFDTRAWPWSAASLDLVVLPHTLEWCADPHLCLREVERVLMPEGRLLVAGLQPMGWWSASAARHLPAGTSLQAIALRRLRDWLRLLDFEVETVVLGGWMPPLRSERGLQKLQWMERWGRRSLPWLHGYYMLLATKRVTGVRWLQGWNRQALPSRRLGTAQAAGSQSLRNPLTSSADPST
jgi:SAM-dependent methyltransferase